MRDIGFSSGVFRTLVLALIIGVGIGCSPDSGTGHPGDDLGTVDTSVDPDGFRTKDVPRWTDLVDTGDTGTAELSPDWTTPDQAHETGTPYDMADTEAVDAPLDEDLDSLEDPDLDDDTGDIEDLSGQETNDIGPDPCQNNSCAVHGESCDEGTSPAWSECEDGNWVIRCRCAPASCKPVCKGAGQVQGWYDGCSGELLALAPCLDCSAMCADGFGWQEDCGNASGEILLEGDCASCWQCDPEAANQCGSCDTRADCLGFLWPEDCPGTWECIGHSCVAQCDETNCGNGVCDTQLGETSQSCPDDCSPCPSGTFGPSCAACPGPADLPCWGRGLCDDGLSGSGICQCSSGFTGDACQSCLPGRFGPTCEPCPGGVVLPCSGHGVCDEGLQGSGLCVCTSGFGGAACQDCAPGHWGPQCMECPGGAVLSCSGHGVCSDGISGTGECSCHDGFGGPLCDQQALVVPDVTGKTLAQALALLRDSGLDDVVTLTDSFADVPAGTVASQLPLGGSIVSPGTQVTVTVSLGDGTQEVLPDPASVAPPLDSAVPWDFTTAVGFLIHGPIPLQRDVDPEALEPHRFALLQGRVLDGNGLAIPGVRVSVVHHPGLGYTLSRADGRFDLVLHGGGPVTVALRRDGYLTSHRLVNIEWAGATRLDDVILVSLDPVVTSVDLGAGPAMVSGSMVTDADGVRTARLFFEGGTEASMILPSGDSVPLSTLNVRATEYSQGESGQARMPADLPSLTAYTYCLELTVDEALSAQATTVQFSKPLYHYVENFLDFPVGSAVPVGYYDRVTAQWVASENGRVIQILGIDNGAAVLDLEGDGLAADESTLDELGVTPQELQSLAGSYAPGQSLWRTPIQHFTPWDCNWPYGPPEDALHPRQGRNPFRRHQQRDNRRAPDCKEPAASTINMVNQSLAEHIEVAGTGLSLHYDSGRVAHESDYTLDIEVIGPESHPDMVSAILFITVAGRAIRQTFPPTPNTDYTFVWDGLDEYGRRVQGKVEATVKIGYTYVAQYYPTSRSFARSFARLSASGASATAQREGAAWAGEGGTREVAPPLVTVWGTFSGTLGIWDNGLTGLGGWALDVHHAFDRRTGKLYKGDGSVHDAEPLGDIIDTVGCEGSAIPTLGQPLPVESVTFSDLGDLKVAPNGDVYVVDGGKHNVYRLDMAGMVHHVAGNGTVERSGDGGPAALAGLADPEYLAIGPDGSIYISERGYSWKYAIRRIAPDGTISTFIGGTDNCMYSWNQDCGDGGLASQARIAAVGGIAVAPDGRVCFSEWTADRIRCVGTDGFIDLEAGTGLRCSNAPVPPRCGDGGAALDASLSWPRGLDFADDGSLLFVDVDTRLVRRIGTDGVIQTVAGTMDNLPLESPDGSLATSVRLSHSPMIAVAMPGGAFYMGHGPDGIRYVNSSGVLRTVAGGPMFCGTYWFVCGSGGLALNAGMEMSGFDRRSDGVFFTAEERCIRKIAHSLGNIHSGDYLVPDLDGQHGFVFSSTGRHLRTVDLLLNATLWQYSYDTAGRLTAITDRDGRTVSVERAVSGTPVGIRAADGRVTLLGVDSDGWLASITDPEGSVASFLYDGGQMISHVDFAGGTHLYQYEDGLLVGDVDPDGRLITLERSVVDNRVEVSVQFNGEGTRKYTWERDEDGNESVTSGFGCCQVNHTVTTREGNRVVTMADGTVISETLEPDPRWGMSAPLVSDRIHQTPGGKTVRRELSRSVYPGDQPDPALLEEQIDTIMHYGRNFTVTYRAALRELRLQTAGWLGITRRFDERGRTIRQTVTGLAEVNNVFDPSGWLTETRIGSGAAQRVHTFLRDLRGNLESVEDPEGHTAQFEFDHLDRLLRVVRADGGETVFSYDGMGRMTEVIPPGQPSHGFLYTAAGRLDTYFPPALPEMAPSVRMLRNEAGDLAAVQRSDGRTLYLSRDPVSAAAIHSMELERGTILLSHDTVTGRVDSISDPDGGIMYFTWDGSLLTSVAWVGEVSGTVTSTYADGTFRLLQEEVAGSPPVAYVYNSDDGLRDVGTMKVYRDSQHNLPKRAVLGKVETQWTHNPFAELQTLEADDGTDSFYSSTWTRNRRGQMTAWAETFPAQSRLRQYTYDSVGRLVSMTEGEVFTEAYSYDQNGNRLSRTLGAATEDATFDSHDRMRTQGDVSYKYAPDGELIRRTRGTDVTSYEYDEMGNLLAVDLPDGRRITYVVDGANHRIGRRVDGVLQEGWLYRGQFQIAASVDASGSVVARYVWGDRGNVPEYMLKGDISYRFVTDHLGSIRMVVRTDTGEVAQWMDYDSYGNVIQDTSPGFQPFGFAGGLLDPDTGLVLFGLRNYSPEMGRWTTKDPMLFLGGSTNLYEYAKGDPLNQVDPTGMNPCKPLTDRWDDADGGGFQVPYWLDGIMGLGGAIWSGLSGPLATIGSGLLGPLTWLVAFEGARQSGETIADRVVTQPDQQLQQTLDDLALESSGSSSRGVGPQD